MISMEVKLQLEVLWTVSDLFSHEGEWGCVSFCFFSACFFFLTLFVFPWPFSGHIHMSRVNRFVRIHPTVSHFHYKTQRIWATARIKSPHLAFIHLPEGSQRFWFSLSAAVKTAVNVWADWLYEAAEWGTHQDSLFGKLIPCLFFSYLGSYMLDLVKSLLSSQQNQLVSDQVFSRNTTRVPVCKTALQSALQMSQGHNVTLMLNDFTTCVISSLSL